MNLGDLEFKPEEFKSIVIPDYLKDQPLADVCNKILTSCAEGFAEVCNRILREKLAKAPEIKIGSHHRARLVCIEEIK